MRSLRQPPTQTLASMIADGKKVVFLTGAGLSAASGIPTFRGQDDSIWVQRATSWGTKAAFLRDPVKWYNRCARPACRLLATTYLSTVSDLVLLRLRLRLPLPHAQLLVPVLPHEVHTDGAERRA